VNVSVQDDIITISGERSSVNNVEDETKRITERSFGRFERSIRLPKDCDVDRVKSKMEHGVLELVFEKKAEKDSGVKKIKL
jgi:HSP20 family protein